MTEVNRMTKGVSILMSVAMAVCVSAGSVPAAPGPVVVDRVVAVVNDEVITMSDLQRESLKRPAGTDQRLTLEDMIDRKLQMVAAKRNGMEVTDRELADAIADIMKRNNMDSKQFEEALAREGLTLEQYRSEFREQMTMSRLFNKFIRTGLSVDEKEIREHYDRNLGQFSLPEEIRVRLLVVTVPEKAPPAQIAESRDKAAALMARIGKGEDFIRLIRENSDSPTAAQDGDLGFMQRGQAIPEIEEAAKDLKPGQYAGPVKAADGFYIIRVEEIRTPVKPFEKVKEEIQKMLYEQKMENTYRAFLQSLRSEAHIENKL
ncbi:MAG: peptidylprolyl cis-trans isomerase, PpiC-type, SurA family [Nitrospirae bacterium]|nr:peptidylprolyl cis-trans isomerase, PpiC-type, SurA family [Nitrospirota bacterium]